jgi:hypothetical protein
MATKIKADFIYSQKDEAVIMVGFADDQFDTEEYVLLQKSLCCDEQDKKLGLDKVHISYKDKSRSTYGGIEKFKLQDGIVEIVLNSEAAAELGVDQIIEIEFPNNDPKLNEIKDKLAELFNENFDVYHCSI